MHTSLERRLFFTLAFVGTLSGCTGSQNVAGTPPLAAAVARADASRSWMLPEARKAKLLYVSDPSANEVAVYSYPKGKLVGALSGFNEPWGLCSDRAGNVFVTDVWNYRVVEYAHGGTSPIATLSNNQGHPQSCSVDPKSGNVAVVYYFINDPSGLSSDVAVYSGGSSSPKLYDGSKIANGMYACAYDDKGNLFVDGIYGYVSVIVGLAELPAGGKQLSDIMLPNHVGHLSSIQWTGKYLAMGDQSLSPSYPALIYQYSIKGSNATQVGTTQLFGTNSLQQFWAVGGKVATPSGSVRIYHYPSGGMPVKTFASGTNPFGLTLSMGAK